MADYAARGADFMKKADKKLNSFGLFSGFGNKYEDGAELLEKAANHFKLAKACEWLMAWFAYSYMPLHWCLGSSSVKSGLCSIIARISHC